jgi:hypothetical protein
LGFDHWCCFEFVTPGLTKLLFPVSTPYGMNCVRALYNPTNYIFKHIRKHDEQGKATLTERSPLKDTPARYPEGTEPKSTTHPIILNKSTMEQNRFTSYKCATIVKKREESLL